MTPVADCILEANHWSNLLWAIRTPSIVNTSELPWVTQETSQQFFQFFSQTQTAAKLHDTLNHYLDELMTHRLGVYFEHLWAFAFTHHPDYSLIGRNVAIRQQGQTMGELDFVVRNEKTLLIEHWEVAVKFYLQVAASPSLNNWVGPGIKDRLDIKLNRMQSHQLAFVHQPDVKSILEDMGIRIDRQKALMPGRLFQPITELSSRLAAPIETSQAGFWWAELADFIGTYELQPWRWYLCPKTSWLSNQGYGQKEGLTSQELMTYVQSAALDYPLCVVATQNNTEQTRGFIVPTGWHQKACSASAKLN